MSPADPPSQRPQVPDWQELYRSTPVEKMPWYSERLDVDLERALAREKIAKGRALDVGSGPGTQATALAKLGFDVIGSDLSAEAVEGASKRAAAGGLRVRYVQDDILATKLEGPFDFAFDRGCFHVLPPASRGDYARTLARLLARRGHLFLKCFSDEQPGTYGPYRFSERQIAEVFAALFEVVSIERTSFAGPMSPPPHALFAVLRQK